MGDLLNSGKIVRIITRLNIGGPAQQAVALSEQMSRLGWNTLLITGAPAAGEGDMGYLLDGKNIRHRHLPAMGRPLHPFRDLKAFCLILQCLFQEKPDILHTHTAKAGALGRAAAWVYRLWTRAPLKVFHTFHGHVLEGYFGKAKTALFCSIERWLARRTDGLIAVSAAVREDLVHRSIAPAAKIRVVHLGLPLKPLLDIPPPPFQKPLRVGIVGRLAPIKNHALFLKAARLLQENNPAELFRFLVIGDGEERPALEKRSAELGLRDPMLRFSGWETDRIAIYRTLDIVCLTSRNEGTPVSILEAMAAARPVISTKVGGVVDLLGAAEKNGSSQGFEIRTRGLAIPSDDEKILAEALRTLAANPELARRLGSAGREFAAREFGVDRLMRDLDRLYRETPV